MSTAADHGKRSGIGLPLLWLPVLLLPPLFLMALQALHQVLPPRDQALARMHVQVLDDPRLPAAGTLGGRDISLPHLWRNGPERSARHVAYHGTLHLESEPVGLWGAFLPRHSMTASLHVNGAVVATGGPHDGTPLPRHWTRPLLTPIPGDLLRAGANQIVVLVSAEPAGTGMLREIYFGTHESLARYGRWHEILRGSLPLTIAVLLFTMAVFMAMLWRARRHETVYKWFAAALFMWAVYCVNVQAVNIPVPARYWEWMRYVSFGSVGLLTVIFVHRFLGMRRPRAERMVAGIGVAGAAVLLVVAALDEILLTRVAVPLWYAVVLAAGIYTAWQLIRVLWRQPSVESSLLLTAGAIMYLCGARDWLVFAGWMEGADGLLVTYTALPVMLVFGAILSVRFTTAQHELEQLASDLEARVQDKHRELTANYDRVRELERQRLLADERERIMRDMHDGVGGQVISTIASIESGRTSLPEVAEAMRAAMEDLRLMIDSLDPDLGDVPTALRTLRGRIDPRLRAAGITPHWELQDLPGFQPLGPAGTLNLMRIVQEALNNALRHSRATSLWLSIRQDEDSVDPSVVVEVRDNGVGMGSDGGLGRGLKNMHRRARSLGGTISVTGEMPGTRVRLTLRGRVTGPSQP